MPLTKGHEQGRPEEADAEGDDGTSEAARAPGEQRGDGAMVVRVS
jgi:hypothetical protein